MSILPVQSVEAPIESQATAGSATKNPRTAQGGGPESAVAKENKTPSPSGGQAVNRQNVTLHEDANGRAYYLVSDAKSGQEIIEVPPKAVRDVSQGIQAYLKAEESKNATNHLEIRG